MLRSAPLALLPAQPRRRRRYTPWNLIPLQVPSALQPPEQESHLVHPRDVPPPSRRFQQPLPELERSHDALVQGLQLCPIVPLGPFVLKSDPDQADGIPLTPSDAHERQLGCERQLAARDGEGAADRRRMGVQVPCVGDFDVAQGGDPVLEVREEGPVKTADGSYEWPEAELMAIKRDRSGEGGNIVVRRRWTCWRGAVRVRLVRRGNARGDGEGGATVSADVEVGSDGAGRVGPSESSFLPRFMDGSSSSMPRVSSSNDGASCRRSAM